MTFFANLLCIIVLFVGILFFSGCKSGSRVNFNPDFYVGDSHTSSIISERGDIIKCDDPRFEDFASMHMEKIKELKTLLIRARLPFSEKSRIQREYYLLENMILDLKEKNENSN